MTRRGKKTSRRAVQDTSAGPTSPPPALLATRVTHHLLNLPLDLYRELFHYLDLDDIVELDLALLNHQLREPYLSALSGTIIPFIPLYPMFLSMLPWLMKRNVLTCEVEICYRLDDKVRQYITQTKEVLQILSLTLVNESDLQRIGACPKLKLVSFRDSPHLTDSVLESFLRNNPQLKALSIPLNSQLSNGIIETIINACPHIQQLDISRCSWVTDASLDLIEKSTLKLRSLNICACNVSKEKIEQFIDHHPSLCYIRVGGYDIDEELLLSVLQRVTLPALQNSDQDIQLLGLQSLQDLSTFMDVISLEPDILHRILPFLATPYTHVSIFPSCFIPYVPHLHPKRFHILALEILTEYAEDTDETFMTENLLPSLVSLLSRDIQTEFASLDESEIQTEVIDFIYSLALVRNDVLQYLISNCLTLLILLINRQASVYKLQLIFLLSRATIPQLTTAFSTILVDEQTRHQGLVAFSKILKDDFKPDVVMEAMKNSNILKYVLEELPESETHSMSVKFRIWSCLDILSSCCHSLVFDPSLLSLLISRIPSLKRYWNELLPTVKDMVSTFPQHHADLIPMLMTLETSSVVVLTCVVEITERSILMEDQFLFQHLVDCGVLVFLTSSLKPMTNFKSALAGRAIKVLHHIMRQDKKYLEMVSSLSLPRSVHRAVMKGFV